MKFPRRPGLLLPLALLLALGGCATAPKLAENPPPAPREFRGVWVATVNNIDWPSQRGLPADQQRAELTAMLDRLQAMGLNAVILQVRPAADALYPSPLEPWSEYLTGTQGESPGYDPLALWVAEAHRRGLELHAWFNPYRARHHEAKSPLAATHIARTNPAVVKQYGELLWMDPGEPFAAERTVAVIRDVVRRYDIDGVHIDDYFYPYPLAKPVPPGAPKDTPREDVEFPDDPARQRYLQAGGRRPLAEWRRENVDRLVERIHATVQAEKPWVKFGISPFGLGRPDRRPAGIKGFSQYDKLNADVELWLGKGWLDYFVPQLYWPLAAKEQSYPVLLDYWLAQNPAQRHVWPGLFTSALSDEKKWSPDDITGQIGLTRARPGATGHVHYSAIALMQDRRGIRAKLAPLYPAPALVPATPWLGTAAPPAPALRKQRDGSLLIKPGQGAKPTAYAIWQRHGAVWRFSVQVAQEKNVIPAADPGPEAVVVTAVDRLGNESPRTALTLRPAKKP